MIIIDTPFKFSGLVITLAAYLTVHNVYGVFNQVGNNNDISLLH